MGVQYNERLAIKLQEADVKISPAPAFGRKSNLTSQKRDRRATSEALFSLLRSEVFDQKRQIDFWV
jgi:hypothetical protein